MIVSLQELELKPVSFSLDIPAGVIDFDNKRKQSSLLHAVGRAELASHSLSEIRVFGDLKVQIAGVCDRCAEQATHEVENHFDLIYVPEKEARVGGEEEIDEAGAEVGYYSGNGLELNDVFREVVLLALPMQIVCQEDCKGVCPVCGENLNSKVCDCQPVNGDDRWNKLKTLRAEIGLRN
jgi:uncharacterized protein